MDNPLIPQQSYTKVRLYGAEPEVHTGLDLWLLLLLASLAGKRCEAVHKLLKKKFAEGLADNAWLDRAVCGHQVSTLNTQLRHHFC